MHQGGEPADQIDPAFGDGVVERFCQLDGSRCIVAGEQVGRR